MSDELARLAVDVAVRLVPFGVSWLLQSTALIAAGLLLARWRRRSGPAQQSLILRATLVAVFVSPLASVLYDRAGATGKTVVWPRAEAPHAVGIPAAEIAAPARAQPAAAPTPAGPASAAVKSTKVVAHRTISPPANAIPAGADVARTIARRAEWSGLAVAYVVGAVAWLGGALWLLVRLAVSHRRIERLRREADLAGVPVFENCGAIARELGISPPEIRIHAGIESPLLVGLLRPAILLPQVEGLENVVASREVLVHELAHHVRGDCFWHLFSRVAIALLWFQPLVWLLWRRIEEAGEEVCDNYVIERTTDRRGYAQQLVTLVEQLQFSSTEALAGTGVIAFRSSLGQRVVRILDASRNLSVRSGARAVAGAVAMAMLGTCTVGLIRIRAAASGEIDLTRMGGAVIRVLMSGTGRELGDGVLSPDETMLALVDWNARGGAVALRDLRTGQKTMLTDNAQSKSFDYATNLVWSPDSKWIAYSWCDGSKDDEYSLRVIARDGGAPRVLRGGSDDLGLSPFDWSRDGKMLVGEFTLADRSAGVAIYSFETGDVRQLSGPLWPRANHARFSPDGRYVVYDRIVDGSRDVFLTDVHTAQTSKLTDSAAENGSPVFSADGRHVLFSSNRRGTWDLWAVELAGNAPRGAPFTVKYDFGDRSKRTTTTGKLAFIIPGSGTDIYEVEDTGALAVDAHEPKAIARSFLGQHASPAWSPDGRRVAYVRRRGEIGQQTLFCIQSRADGREETFETGLEFIRRIFWSPDGRAVAITGQGRGNEVGTYLLSLETLEIRPIKTAPGAPPWPIGFSPDGREFLFSQWSGKDRVALELATGVTRDLSSAEDLARIAAAPDLAREFDLSPDQSAVVYVAREGNEQQLIVTDPRFQRKDIIARVTRPQGIVSPRWSPDRAKVAYYVTEPGGGAHRQLQIAAADGSWQRTVDTGKKYISGGAVAVDWSPDGTKLAVTLSEDSIGEVGVLENFFAPEMMAAR